LDKLYGNKGTQPAPGEEPAGETTEPAIGDLGGFGEPASLETGAPETPEAPAPGGGDAAVTPESIKDKDMNLLIEDDILRGQDVLDLSKGRKSLGKIEDKLNELLNK
jgi:hypothetical protein